MWSRSLIDLNPVRCQSAQGWLYEVEQEDERRCIQIEEYTPYT